jgi:glyoxylase-like metal-dependent hydrolase (beta-lactamase superfamily II)
MNEDTRRAQAIRRREVPLWVHPDEIVVADGIYHPQHADPIARWTIEPLMWLMPRRAARLVARSGLGEAARAFDPDRAPPGMADWVAVPSPGRTPGHVAFFRPGQMTGC